jgi:N-acetyl-alpha-D-muramate 1-phosphate uridylyltransferase
MILAAGRGERMKPLTDRLPKPLLTAGGKPLIVWLIDALVRAGIDELVINVSHLGGQIEEALGDGSRFGARIAYSREPVARETAGGITLALPLLGAAPFIVVNGDIHVDYDFRALAQRATSLQADAVLAHLVLVDNPPHHPAGDFVLERGFVNRDGAPRLTFSGMGAYHPALFDPVTPGERYQLAALLREPLEQRRVSGEYFRGTWIDVGTPQRLAELDRELTRRA